ncbi:MAG: hypothetical protein AABX05_01505 [Nanoarchaeota archaeon]
MIALPFAKKEKRRIFRDRYISDTTLEKGLKDPLMFRFVRQLTGMEDPSILVELGKYFDNPARVYIFSSNETRSAWFGCISLNFFLNGNYNLSNSSAARGVSFEAP